MNGRPPDERSAQSATVVASFRHVVNESYEVEDAVLLSEPFSYPRYLC